jgi:amino acid transporter
MIFVVIAIVLVWKPLKRTRFYRSHEVDLVSDIQDINDYTEDFALREEAAPMNRFQKSMAKIW